MTRSRLAAASVVAAVAGCGAAAPCDDAAGTCLAIRVTSTTVDAIDQLDLDVLYGFRHDVAHTQLDGGGVVRLPLDTALLLDADAALEVGVVAGGKLGGNLLGTGAAATTIAPGEHGTLSIALAPVAACQDQAFYCGGDQVAGDPGTLYQCDDGAVPQARGRCVHGCTINPGADDRCAAGPDPCVEGGFYCGGNKVEGDPRTLYRCSAGTGMASQVCADACVVMPPGSDDACL